MVHYLDFEKTKSFHNAFATTESKSDIEIPQFTSKLGGMY